MMAPSLPSSQYTPDSSRPRYHRFSATFPAVRCLMGGPSLSSWYAGQTQRIYNASGRGMARGKADERRRASLAHGKCTGSVVGFDRSVRGTRRFFTATEQQRRTTYGSDPIAGCHLQAGKRGPYRRVEHTREAQLRHPSQPDPGRVCGADLPRQPEGRRDPGPQGLPGDRCDPDARGHGRSGHPRADGRGGHRGVRQGGREVRRGHHRRVCRSGRGRREAPGAAGEGGPGARRAPHRAQLPGGEYPLQ